MSLASSEGALVLSRADARTLTDQVKRDAEQLWRNLVELYEGGAHTALGHGSWGAYFKAEFGGSERRGYQLLEAGRVIEQLKPVQHFALPANDGQARELVPLLDQPEQLREAWAEASANGEPTALKVREAVQQRTLIVPVNQQLLERQQRQTLINGLDRAVRALEMSASHARAEAKRLLRGGDPHPFTPERFDRVSEYAAAFAAELRKERHG